MLKQVLGVLLEGACPVEFQKPAQFIRQIPISSKNIKFPIKMDTLIKCINLIKPVFKKYYLQHSKSHLFSENYQKPQSILCPLRAWLTGWSNLLSFSVFNYSPWNCALSLSLASEGTSNKIWASLLISLTCLFP